MGMAACSTNWTCDEPIVNSPSTLVITTSWVCGGRTCISLTCASPLASAPPHKPVSVLQTRFATCISKTAITSLITLMTCGVSSPERASAGFSALRSLLQELGLDEAYEKAVSPTTRLTFIGLEVDTIAMTVSVPEDKLCDLESILNKWQNKRRCTKRQLQSLIGKLSFVATCIPPGRIFMSRLLQMLRLLYRQHHHAHLTQNFRKDIQWWQTFLRSYNGISLILEDNTTPVPDAIVASDACLTGCGGIDTPKLSEEDKEASEGEITIGGCCYVLKTNGFYLKWVRDVCDTAIMLTEHHNSSHIAYVKCKVNVASLGVRQIQKRVQTYGFTRDVQIQLYGARVKVAQGSDAVKELTYHYVSDEENGENDNKGKWIGTLKESSCKQFKGKLKESFSCKQFKGMLKESFSCKQFKGTLKESFSCKQFKGKLKESFSCKQIKGKLKESFSCKQFKGKSRSFPFPRKIKESFFHAKGTYKLENYGCHECDELQSNRKWETFMAIYTFLDAGENGENITYWRSSDTNVSADYNEDEISFLVKTVQIADIKPNRPPTVDKGTPTRMPGPVKLAATPEPVKITDSVPAATVVL
ncbi:hypothetical protein QZH41_001423 [Actinostola sp. cb2023]|nr:hypothetical protein QZH41_001423 [Actinostola sp. cb2023]